MNETELLDIAQSAFQMFMDARPNIQMTTELAIELASRVTDSGWDQFKAGSYLRAWEAIEAEKQRAVELDAQRQKDREDYFRPSSDDRRALVEAFKSRQTSPRNEFVPAREYSEAEQSRMSSSEFRRAILGVLTLEDKQGSSGIVYKPERTGERKTSTSFRALKKRGIERL